MRYCPVGDDYPCPPPRTTNLGQIPSSRLWLTTGNDPPVVASVLLSCPSHLGSRCRLRLRKPAVFHAVTAPVHGDHLRMMEQAIEESSRSHLVAEQHAPLRKGAVAGQENRSLFVASGHQVKERLGLARGQTQIADFVNDQEAWGSVATPLLAPTRRL